MSVYLMRCGSTFLSNSDICYKSLNWRPFLMTSLIFCSVLIEELTLAVFYSVTVFYSSMLLKFTWLPTMLFFQLRSLKNVAFRGEINYIFILVFQDGVFFSHHFLPCAPPTHHIRVWIQSSQRSPIHFLC